MENYSEEDIQKIRGVLDYYKDEDLAKHGLIRLSEEEIKSLSKEPENKLRYKANKILKEDTRLNKQYQKQMRSPISFGQAQQMFVTRQDLFQALGVVTSRVDILTHILKTKHSMTDEDITKASLEIEEIKVKAVEDAKKAAESKDKKSEPKKKAPVKECEEAGDKEELKSEGIEDDQSESKGDIDTGE